LGATTTTTQLDRMGKSQSCFPYLSIQRVNQSKQDRFTAEDKLVKSQTGVKPITDKKHVIVSSNSVDRSVSFENGTKFIEKFFK